MGELRELAKTLKTMVEDRTLANKAWRAILAKRKGQKLTEEQQALISDRKDQKQSVIFFMSLDIIDTLLVRLSERYSDEEATEIYNSIIPVLEDFISPWFPTKDSGPDPKPKNFGRCIDKLYEADAKTIIKPHKPVTFGYLATSNESTRIEMFTMLLVAKNACDEFLDSLGFLGIKWVMRPLMKYGFRALIEEKYVRSSQLCKFIKEFFERCEELRRYSNWQQFSSKIIAIAESVKEKKYNENDEGDVKNYCRLLLKIKDVTTMFEKKIYQTILEFSLDGRLKAEAWLKALTYGFGHNIVDPLEYEAVSYGLSRGWDLEKCINKISTCWHKEIDAEGLFKQFEANFAEEWYGCPASWGCNSQQGEWLNLSSAIRCAEWGRIREFYDPLESLLNEFWWWSDRLDFKIDDVPAVISEIFLSVRSSFITRRIKDSMLLALKQIRQLSKDKHILPSFYNSYDMGNICLLDAARFVFIVELLGEALRDDKRMRNAINILLSEQKAGGWWPIDTGDTGQSVFTTATAIHALSVQKYVDCQSAIKKAAEWLWSVQKPNGSWEDYGFNRVWGTVFVLDAIDLSEGKKQLTFKLSDAVLAQEDIQPARNKHKDTVKTIIDYRIDEAVKTTIKEVRLMYEVIIAIYQWANDEMPDSYNAFLPIWTNLYVAIDDRMERILEWLKWNKPEVAKDLQKEYDRLLEWGHGDKWEDGDRDDIVTGITATKGCAIGLQGKLRNIAEVADQAEREKSGLNAQNQTNPISLNNFQLFINSLIEDFGNVRKFQTDISPEFIEVLNYKVEHIKQRINGKGMKQNLAQLYRQFQWSARLYKESKQKSSQCVEEIEVLADLYHMIGMDIDNIVQYLQTVIYVMPTKASSSKTEQNKAYIKKGSPVWEFGFENGQAQADSRLKGFALIEFLLLHPNEEYTPLELLQKTKQRGKGEGKSQKIYSQGEIETLREAIEDLKIQAQNEPDIERKEDLEEEIETTQAILYKSRNFKGKSRGFSEKHRLSVIRNIQTVLNKIAPQHKELYSHLDTFLKRGETCSYKPDTKIIWEIS